MWCQQQTHQKGPLKTQTTRAHRKTWLCPNPRAPGAAALRRPNTSKGSACGALGIFLALPSSQSQGVTEQGHIPACSDGATHKQQPSEAFAGWGSKAPPAAFPLWYREAGVFHLRKIHEISQQPGPGWGSEAAGEELFVTPFSTEPCWIQLLQKNRQTNKDASLVGSVGFY